MNAVEKIKKLLRLSQSPHRAEAELALQRAFEIAAKYHVDIELLDLGDDLNTIVRESVHIGYRLSMMKRLAIGVAQAFFNVTPVISYPSMYFIGTESDIAIALHVIEFLSDRCRSETSEMANLFGRKFTERRRRSFVQGFYYGIASRLHTVNETLQLSDHSTALALRSNKDRRDSFVAQEIGRTQVVRYSGQKREDKTFAYRGYVRGRSVEIRPAAGAAPDRPRLAAAGGAV